MSEVKQRAIHELKMSEAEGTILVAFAQLDAVDEDEDFTFAGAFKEKSVPMSAYQHNSWPERGGLLPPGIGDIKEIGGWAVFDGRMFMDTDHGRNTFHTVKGMGEAQQWSYGYDVLSTAPVPHGIKAKRGLKEIDTHEVSPVLLGAQPTAHTMTIKALKGAGRNVADAQYALNSILGLIAEESDVEDGEQDTAEDKQDVTWLSQARDALTAYITATAKEVGSPEDLADLAAEAAAATAQAMANRYISSSSRLLRLKGRPLTGETFDAHVSRLLADVRDFEDRAKGLTGLRLKEGRAISAARLAQFEEHAEALLLAHAAFRTVIDAAQPKPKDPAAKLRRMRMEAQLGIVNLDLTH